MSKTAARQKFHAQWLERSKTQDPTLLDELLSTLTDEATSAFCIERLSTFASWPYEPKIAQGLLKFFEKPPFISPGTRPFWISLLYVFARHADHDAVAILENLNEAKIDGFGPEMLEWFRYWRAKLVDLISVEDNKYPSFSGDLLSLSSVPDHLKEKNFESAVHDLLEAWRTTRWVDLATVIDVICQQCATPSPKIKAGLRHKNWLERIEKLDTFDLQNLFETITKGSHHQCSERISRLMRLPPDPRIGAWASRTLMTPPAPSHYSAMMLVHFLAYHHADPRTVEALRNASSSRPELVIPAEVTFARLQNAGFPKPTEEQLGIITKINRLVGAKKQKKQDSQNSDFLQSIYDDPKNDGVRQVYADWLIENKDPRGEFINLQYSRLQTDPAKYSQLERKLLKKHFDEWVGELAPVIRPPGTPKGKQTWFERGFLTSCQVRRPSVDTLNALLDDPGWSTVEELHLDDNSQKVIMSPHLISLDRLTGLSDHRTLNAKAVKRLANTLKTIELGVDEEFFREQPALQIINLLRELKGLESLLIRNWVKTSPYGYGGPKTPKVEYYRPLLESKFGTNLKTLGIRPNLLELLLVKRNKKDQQKKYYSDLRTSFETWLGFAKSPKAKIKRFVLYSGPSTREPFLEITPDKQNQWRTLTCVVPNPCINRNSMQFLDGTLEFLGLLERPIESFRILAPGRKKPTKTEGSHLESALARLKKAKVDIELPKGW